MAARDTLPVRTQLRSNFCKHSPLWAADRRQNRVQRKVSAWAPISATPIHHRRIPRWITHLGAPGLFLVSVIDSSIVPLPIPGSTDLLLLFLVAHRGNPWLLASTAIAGSLVGGYTTWRVGKKGGETALQRYVPRRKLDRVSGWVTRHPILSVWLPAVLPPPIPLSPFILASGALGVPRTRFLAVFGAARTFRYAAIAWMAALYGRRIVRQWNSTLDRWSKPLLYTFLALLAASILFAVWKMRRPRRTDNPGEVGVESA